MRVGHKISLLVVGAVLATTVVLAIVGYTRSRRQYVAGIDKQLTAMAGALPRVIGDAYLHRAFSDSGITPDDYNRMVATLNEVADAAGIYYVYAFAKSGDQVVHLATSASESERAAGEWATFREPYHEPPPELLETFADGMTRFAEYTDEFGSFRSIFIRHPGAGGTPYVIGVDVSLADIHAHLSAMLVRSLGAGTLVALLAGALGVLMARQISRPLLHLSQEVDAWANRDFSSDDSIRAQLEQIARGHRDEAGDLARRFVDVQDRLQSYLRELARTTAEKQKIENQLEIARTIQESLLPAEMPKIENFEITGWCQPADQTGGDYFDCIQLPNGEVVLTIGDVTGHGIGPALVTAASRAYARATMDAEEALDVTITRLNELLHGDLRGERFVTLVACLLNPATRHLKFVAAGHGPIMFYSRRLDRVDVTTDSQGIPLGIMNDMPYERPVDLHFEPGDVLVLVSDGFFEWMNNHGEQFGTSRLANSIHASCRDEPNQIIERLRRDVAAFHGGTAQSDDTTALVVRCVS